MVTSAEVRWDSRERAVAARRQRRLGALVLSDEPRADAEPGQVTGALLAGIRELGLAALPWTPELRQWQARVLLCGRAAADTREPWPDVSDAHLLATLDTWLAPWLAGVTRRSHLARVDLKAALQGLLDYDQQRRLEGLAPTHLPVPSGSRVPIDYLEDATPSVAVRLQEVFGLKATPHIAGGRVGLLFKLLSPARRPVQLTRDLASFWNNAYHDVRRELKGPTFRRTMPILPARAESAPWKAAVPNP